MEIITFSDLADKNFYVKRLTVFGTMERPFRTYRCNKQQIRRDRLFYIREGTFEITQDGHETIVTHAGDLLYLPNDCEYSAVWTSENISYIYCAFVLADRRSEFSMSEKIMLLSHDRGGVIGDQMERLDRIWQRGELGYRIKCGALFLELLHCITLEQVQADLGKSFSDISAAILHLENNYIGDISVSELAKLCGMCESRFRSRFLEYAGMPPIQYRNCLRAKKAAELLSGGDCTVAEAAELVGIPDVAYFSRVFRKYCGTNPGELRNRQA